MELTYLVTRLLVIIDIFTLEFINSLTYSNLYIKEKYSLISLLEINKFPS